MLTLSFQSPMVCDCYFVTEKSPYFAEVEIDAFASLLDSMFCYDPSERPSAAKLLEHPWLQGQPLDRLKVA